MPPLAAQTIPADFRRTPDFAGWYPQDSPRVPPDVRRVAPDFRRIPPSPAGSRADLRQRRGGAVWDGRQGRGLRRLCSSAVLAAGGACLEPFPPSPGRGPPWVRGNSPGGGVGLPGAGGDRQDVFTRPARSPGTFPNLPHLQRLFDVLRLVHTSSTLPLGLPTLSVSFPRRSRLIYVDALRCVLMAPAALAPLRQCIVLHTHGGLTACVESSVLATLTTT